MSQHKKNALYRQCHLVKKTKDGSELHQATWVPETFAVVGKVLRLRDEAEGIWEDGWTVRTVGSTSCSGDLLAVGKRARIG